MKKIIVIIISLIVVMVFSFISPSNVLAFGKVKKAEQCMQKKMYKQAKGLLHKKLDDDPLNGKANYLLGLCYYNTGNWLEAKQWFGYAIKIDSDYAIKLGEELKSAGSASLQRGRTKSAIRHFKRAVWANPELKKEIANKCYRAGISALDKGQISNAKELLVLARNFNTGLSAKIAQESFSRGQSRIKQKKYNSADGHFNLAVMFNASLAEKISDIFFKLGEETSGTGCLAHYYKAKNFSKKHNEAIKEKLLAISKSKFDEKEIREWRKCASDFGKIPPDYKIYPPGNYAFSLKAGQRTDHWIQLTDGVYYSVKSDDDKFKLLYFDGEIVPAWTPGNWPNKSKFKIIAVTDQSEIKMVVRR